MLSSSTLTRDRQQLLDVFRAENYILHHVENHGVCVVDGQAERVGARSRLAAPRRADVFGAGIADGFEVPLTGGQISMPPLSRYLPLARSGMRSPKTPRDAR